MDKAVVAVGGTVDPVQGYFDLLEVRWLLSERAGHDVGDDPALEALARRSAPDDAAATLAVVELPTAQTPALTPKLLAELGGSSPPAAGDASLDDPSATDSDPDG